MTMKWKLNRLKVTGIFIGILIIAGTLYSTNLLFQKSEMFHIQLSATLFFICFTRALYLLFTFIDRVTLKKIYKSVISLFHFLLLALIDVWLFYLFFMHLGAPSVGD